MALPWSDLPFLLALARAGTLSATARMLKLDRTTIARRIEQLEELLGEALFDRLDGRYSLTPYGRRIFAAAESAEQDLLFLEKSGDGRQARSRKIRVSLSEHLLLTLADCFRIFMMENPDIILELTATDRLVDLSRFESDVALRITRAAPRDLMATRIGRPVFALYRRKGSDGGEERYIARPSEDRTPRYVLKHAPRAEPSIAVDGMVSARELIAQGFGVGILPRYFADRDPRIECCSGPLPDAGFTLFIVLRPEQQKQARMRQFVDHVFRCLTGLSGLDTAVSPPAEHRNG